MHTALTSSTIIQTPTGLPFEFKEDSVAAPSQAYLEMAQRWELLKDLREGTDAMRARGGAWLPQEPKESDAAYRIRLGRSFLFSAYDDTVTKLSARPFKKPVVVENAPEALAVLEKDVAGDGQDLTQFCRACFDAGIDRGMYHILVDFSNTTGAETLADERRLGARPFYSVIAADDLFAWTFEEDETSGVKRLTSIRFFERRLERVGQWKDEWVWYVRVMRAGDAAGGSWELHRFNPETKVWLLHKKGRLTLDQIPLVTVYFNRKGFMVARPPLEDLAHLNLAHWQSNSDHRNILRFSRFGLLFAKGFKDEDIQSLEIGPNRLIHSSDTAGDLKYVEHQGSAIAAGERDLSSLRAEMEVMGLQPLVARAGNPTATGRSIDEARAHSEMQAWVMALTNGIRAAYTLAAKWVRTELSEDFDVNINTDFVVSPRVAEDIKALLEMRKIKEITSEVLLIELKKRGLIGDEHDITSIIDELESEADEALKLFADEKDEVNGAVEEETEEEEEESDADADA